MRQPFQLDPPEIAAEPQRGEIAQRVDLDEMQRFQLGKASEQAEIERLAEAEEQRLKLRAARQRAQRQADRGVDERELLQAVLDVAQTFAGPHGRTLHVQPLQAGKVPEELKILHRVAVYTQRDVAPAGPQRGHALHVSVALGLAEVDAVASRVQRT